MEFNKRIMLIILLAFSLESIAQDLSWDKYDVTEGPNPTLRYGYYTESDGIIKMGRYYFIDNGSELKVRLAPYGKTATDLPVLEFDRNKGIIRLGWEGKPKRKCKLIKQGESLFIGNCIEENLVMPMVIRNANENDQEWMGVYFAVSDTDISILKKAKEIILSKDSRNLKADRNCDDDIATRNFSFYCSLYYAAIEVDGVYRHRRPAMQTVRKELVKRYPGNYVHRIRDINNNPKITNEELLEVLDVVISDLTFELKRK
ncbi:hypothetical protein AAGF08_19485 [Algoriphagus sp. SE2]|uniref:hypothetical protein n=1 Tax=Algoriphagus sp. SE2 TaxID=3141536 RepID=UPI0031CD468D